MKEKEMKPWLIGGLLAAVLFAAAGVSVPACAKSTTAAKAAA